MWTAIAAFQLTDPDVLSVIYAGDIKLIAKVKVNFSCYQCLNCLHLSREYVCQALHLVFLNTLHLVEDSTWPRFTLLGQSIGSRYFA